MIRFGVISKMMTSIMCKLTGLGGVTENRFVSPKGLYSKPQGENALIIPLANGTHQDVVFAIQKEKPLGDGDVYVTDDVSYIHFKFRNNSIELKTDSLVFNVKKFTVNADSVDFQGCTVKNDGVSIDKTHIHPQNNGNDYGGSTDTGPPE